MIDIDAIRPQLKTELDTAFFCLEEQRLGNIWENIELPRLKNNPNVTKITIIDPKTGIENVI